MEKKIGKLLIMFLLLFNATLYARSRVKIDIQLLTPGAIGEITLKKKIFFKWIKKTYKAINGYLAKEKGDRDVVVIATVHKNKPVSLQVSARPAISSAFKAGLLRAITKLSSPSTRLVDYSFAFVCRINNGHANKKDPFTPALLTPTQQRIAAYKELDLAGKKQALQIWVQKDLLPLFAYLTSNVDKKYKGVLAVGGILKEKKYVTKKNIDLTGSNFNYWRAVMEMERGNQLIPFAQACMLIVTDDFDKAYRFLSMFRPFVAPKTTTYFYFEEMYKKISMLRGALNSAIKKGIALHDKGKYKEAIRVYRTLLKILPKSAYLHYEVYYSKSAQLKDMKAKDAAWKKAKRVIYGCDPMYHMSVRATTGQEGYLLFLRRETQQLFKAKDRFERDFLRYADIALDLKDYMMAAHLYWLVFSYIDAKAYKGRDILAYYLYCLYKLGNNEILTIFKKNYRPEFVKIEASRKKIMEASPFFKAFKKGY